MVENQSQPCEDDSNQNTYEQVIEQKELKKRRKRKQAKQRKIKLQKKSEEEQFVEMLQELKSEKVEQKVVQQDEMEELLSINEGRLDFQKELKRHFQQYEAVESKEGRREKKMRKAMAGHRKSVLVPGFQGLPQLKDAFQLQKTMVEVQSGMGRFEEYRVRFVSSRKYDFLQQDYEAIRNGGDINQLFDFMQMHPQHAGAAYYVGEFLRLRGNYAEADALLQKVLFLFQAGASTELRSMLQTGRPTLRFQFDQLSKSFFFSLFKFVDILGRKGCFKAALEFNKLLLKLNNDDPTGALLCMDYNCISAGHFSYLRTFVLNYSGYLRAPQHSLYLLPNFTYSFALSVFHSSKSPQPFSIEHWNSALASNEPTISLASQKETKMQDQNTLLLRALLLYPRVMAQIAKINEYVKLAPRGTVALSVVLQTPFWIDPPSNYSHFFLGIQTEQDSQGLSKLLSVYLERSKVLWKAGPVVAWAAQAMTFIAQKVDQGFNHQQYLQRQCLADANGLPPPFLLRRYSELNKNNFSDRVERINLEQIQQPARPQPPPLPQNIFAAFFRSLLPWVDIPHDPNQPIIEDEDD